MRRINWLVVAVTAVVGAGLAALVQWWPRPQECAGSSNAPCPSGRVAGSISAVGVIAGFALGALVAVLVLALSARERVRRERWGEQ